MDSAPHPASFSRRISIASVFFNRKWQFPPWRPPRGSPRSHRRQVMENRARRPFRGFQACRQSIAAQRQPHLPRHRPGRAARRRARQIPFACRASAGFGTADRRIPAHRPDDAAALYRQDRVFGLHLPAAAANRRRHAIDTRRRNQPRPENRRACHRC